MLKKIKEFFVLHQKNIYQLLLVIGMLCVCTDIFAEGKDLLDGTADDLIQTINTTGKTYIYLAEGILSAALYIKSKNLLVLAGILCQWQLLWRVSNGQISYPANIRPAV
jgi:hypothetical protein